MNGNEYKQNFDNLEEKCLKRIENKARESEEKTNKNRKQIEYEVGQFVFIKNPTPKNKLEKKYFGPFEILEIFGNSLGVRKEHGIFERVNLKRCIPFKGEEDVMGL